VVSQVTPSQSDALELLDYVILVLRENIINLSIAFGGKKQREPCVVMSLRPILLRTAVRLMSEGSVCLSRGGKAKPPNKKSPSVRGSCSVCLAEAPFNP
jgi:hypothetical protein